MFTDRSRRLTSLFAVFVLSLLTLFPHKALGEGVQDGKWKVTAAKPGQALYWNATGSTRTLMVTVCNVSGGTINIIVEDSLGGTNTSFLETPDCLSITSPVFGFVRVHLESGTGASGTYQVSLVP